MTSTSTEFKRLHERGIFVIPNAWDAGSARLFEGAGFQAIATTSSGLAWTLGRSDYQVTLDEVLAHGRALAAAVRIPVSVDFEGGFALRPEDVAANVSAAATTGIAGLSIEDSTRNAGEPLIEFQLAVDRIAAARQALDRSGTGVLLTARSEGFIVGRPDLGETIRRLVAFAGAGADCLFAPGLRSLDDIAEIVRAVAPKPVNVLAASDFTTVSELAALGVRRISVGGALTRTAASAALEAVQEISERGTFGALARAKSFAELSAQKSSAHSQKNIASRRVSGPLAS